MLISKNFLRLLPLLLLIFLDSFSFFVVIPVFLKIFYHARYGLLPVTTTLAQQNKMIGITLSLSMLAALLSAPFVGAFSDNYGRKKTLLFCLLCVTIGFLLPIIGILKKNLYLILIGRFIAGIGSSSQPIAQASVADLSRDTEKAYFLSLIALMMTLALILGPLIGGYLTDTHWVHWFSITTPLSFALGLSVFNILLLLFFFKETLNERARNSVTSLKSIVLGLSKAIKTFRFGLLLITFFFLELGWSQYYQSISLFLHLQLHYSVDKISLFTATMGITMSLGLLILYPLFLRIASIKSIMRYSVSLVFIGLFSCALFPFSTAHWIFSNLIAVATGCAYVSLVALISNKMDSKNQGKTMGYLSTLLYLAWMITAFDGGFLVSWHTALPIYLSTFFLFIACFGIV
ncbi:MAG: hypothetical protein COY58_08320 [Gammaproteobacteria bacterium CG_4_10_14_0_8_um_filter_38_16]|nr:MAG: hypothetical protein COY58_08320 [Gammaproteobacteria bacterium CG_4_10_14_0_8_um_filter_38_16]PJA03721.1 MAG: hypothetical protein COX72_03630 [Gammaproteobacteria bacterium CG_4_10_14_0_2_um_filter_38_22]PJB09916.1 MAG: hypothetical protein CO120_07605 [Gammaproteobacteria bacterium CG_4_9_14_3_um_filter_38_9]